MRLKFCFRHFTNVFRFDDDDRSTYLYASMREREGRDREDVRYEFSEFAIGNGNDGCIFDARIGVQDVLD